MRYCDAHAHLHEACLEAALAALRADEEAYAVLTNGTCPADWEAVAALEDGGALRILKAYGVHPWKVADLPADWEALLRARLESGAVSVGEIGLDYGVEPCCRSLQREVFERQLYLASGLGLVPTVHAVRAEEEVAEVLRAVAPASGFLLHGFGGSRPIQRRLLDLGGYFSFSARAADPRYKRQREAIAYCPADRLLSETDAPYRGPPEDRQAYPLFDARGRPLHDPREIRTAVRVIAELRAEEPGSTAETVARTFGRLFGVRQD